MWLKKDVWLNFFVLEPFWKQGLCTKMHFYINQAYKKYIFLKRHACLSGLLWMSHIFGIVEEKKKYACSNVFVGSFSILLFVSKLALHFMI